MSAAYPSSIASFPTYSNLDLITPTVANQPDGEIVAVETGLLNGFAHDLKSDATGNNRSLGVSGNAFYNLLLSNNATIGGDATIGGNATIGGTFAVTGAADMSGGAKIVSGQTALDLFYAASGTTVGRIAVGTGLQSLRVNAGATGYEFYTPVSNVPFSAFFGTVFENLTRLNTSVYGSASSPAITTLGMQCDTSSSAGGAACGCSAYLASSLGSMGLNLSVSGSFSLDTKGSDGIIYCGNALDAGLIIGGASSFTPKHWGFKLVWASSGNAALSATQSDGTTEAATVMDSNIIQGDDVVVFAYVSSASTIDYYYWKNGGPISALTRVSTHFPTSGGRALECSVSNRAIASQTVVTFHGAGLGYA